MGNFSQRVESWRPLIRAGANPDFILSVIQIESDGEFPHKSSGNERGPTEVSKPESIEILHMSAADFDRMMVDRQYSLDKGIDLLDYYRLEWIPRYLDWTDSLDLMRAAKATHAGGLGFMASLINHLTAFYARQPANWQEMKTGLATIASNGWSYKDSSGASHTVSVSVKDLGSRVMKQIDKLDRLMGTSSGVTFDIPEPIGASIAARLSGIPRPMKIGAGLLAVLAVIAIGRRKS